MPRELCKAQMGGLEKESTPLLPERMKILQSEHILTQLGCNFCCSAVKDVMHTFIRLSVRAGMPLLVFSTTRLTSVDLTYCVQFSNSYTSDVHVSVAIRFCTV